ncbi:hypothetical protein [Arenibacter latericius]|uniref:hypothetical protein n=1 Tax=Arenibacter latericius TaxID=86104 RepID=UPI000403755B|nr:hypothetical protein [Arenibacter latericius]
MKNISHEVSHLTYKRYNITRIAQALLKKGYTPDEIQKALENSNINNNNKNRIIAVLLLVVGILANLYTKSTYINNFFRFDFFSQADFMLFNERILKPTITLSMIYLGINLLINRNNISKVLKVFLLVFLTVFLFTITSYYSLLAFIFSAVALLLIAFIELPQKIENPEMVQIFPHLNKEWKGTSGFVFLLLGIVLVYSSHIRIEYVSTEEGASTGILSFLDYFLIYLKPVYCFIGVIASLLVSINFNKFKISFYILGAFSTIFLVVGLIHPVFQNIIYGSSIILISWIFIFLNNDKKYGLVKK